MRTPPGPHWMTLEVTLSKQSVTMLDKLSEIGVLGATTGEVAARFIDEALRKFVQPPVFDMSLRMPVPELPRPPRQK